jgi:hypothetical protein
MTRSDLHEMTEETGVGEGEVQREKSCNDRIAQLIGLP